MAARHALRHRVTDLALAHSGDLAAFRIDLFRIDLGDPAPGAAEMACLDEAERRRAAAFLRPEPRARFVWSRLALRALVATRLGVAPDRVPLGLTAQGRPFVEAARPDGTPPLDFNLSHAADLGLIALLNGPGRVGVDLERVRPIPDWRQVAQLVFTANERAGLARREGDALDAFYRLWTAKEACLKAIGTGFLTDPRAVALDLGADGQPTGLTMPAGCLKLIPLQPAPGFVGALAFTPQPEEAGGSKSETLRQGAGVSRVS